jgi:hypothetical protein
MIPPMNEVIILLNYNDFAGIKGLPVRINFIPKIMLYQREMCFGLFRTTGFLYNILNIIIILYLKQNKGQLETIL